MTDDLRIHLKSRLAYRTGMWSVIRVCMPCSTMSLEAALIAGPEGTEIAMVPIRFLSGLVVSLMLLKTLGHSSQ